MVLTELPNEIFLLIVDQLGPKDLILHRRVNKQFHTAFTENELNYHFLQHHFPRVKELRHVEDWRARTDWSEQFSRVVRRYHHLQSGRPRGIEIAGLGKSFIAPTWSRSYPVVPWRRHLQFEEKTAQFHYPDTLWTYDDGLLVFPSAELKSYAVYDLSARILNEIDIDSGNKIVRRIRLKEKTLIIEWCETEPYHQLNEYEKVHRHFTTSYDICLDPRTGKYQSIFRNEWKIHFLGFPLNSRDRFYSTHNKNHYAIYIWQPNRSAWGEDEPIEMLAIWDISRPSAYRPSTDPTGNCKPADEVDGPNIIRRFTFLDLGFYGIRQRSSPTFRALELDENHVYFICEDHRWLVGAQSSDRHPRLHKVKSTGIPFGSGPHWEDECGADGDVNLSFCERNSDDRSPGTAPCWRHEEFPYLTITEALDAEAGVIFSARHCFMLETISINIKPKIKMIGPGYEISLRDGLWQQLLGKGKICGDERWLIGENTRDEVVILHFDQEGGSEGGISAMDRLAI
ncbi:hypothetical protein HYALB_00001353 [Hymenoscyphus albidus]|uniref:F-box domain-containing protein n=1 Tax=Hymenoscyphus albidus TaxID=595503 RepID=A0A9N9LFR7_9HELO|nr:hypothetical protein HYALB_00001353 [Hymenoscyphus albidus]